MILAAGLGTRLRPLTDHLPKALVPVDGTPLLEGLIRRLQKAGFDEFVVNVHHFPEQIEDFLQAHGNFGSRITLSDERDLLRETGGAIRHAAQLLQDAPGGSFLVHNVDIVTDLDYTSLTKAIRQGGTPRQGLSVSPEGCPQRPAGSPIVATLAVSDRKTSRYLLFDETMRLVGWTNIDTGEVRSPWPNLDAARCRRLAFSGISMLSTAILPLMQSWPERFSIIDFYLAICRDHEIRGLDVTGAAIRDVGKLKEWEVRA
jgi:NDP-sugar pyrophosphorylase family protein